MPYQVYLLRNPDNRTYIGLTENVRTRLRQHNEGVSKWTKSRGPWCLTWISYPHPSLGEARKLESLLKRQKGGTALPPLLQQHGKSLL